MRLPLLLIAFIFAFPVAAFCQNAPKGANTIIVASTFNEACIKLLDAGYFIDKKDSTLGTIVSSPKYIKKVDGNIIIQVRIKDSLAYISGLLNQNIAYNGRYGTVDFKEYSAIENKGMKNSPAKQFFNAMEDFAKSFNKRVDYKTL